MSIFKKSLISLCIVSLVFSVLLVFITILFISALYHDKNIIPFVILFFVYIFALCYAIYRYSDFLSVSFQRLVRIVNKGALLLSNSGTDEQLPINDFKNLERAMRDITLEVNRRLEQAKAEGSRLEAILNGMSEAVFAMDSGLRLHLVNPKARELFNLGSCDINTASSGNIMTLLEATRCTELVETAKKAISFGSPLETELTLHTGIEQHFQVYTSPLAQGVVIVLQEITKLVKLERMRKDFVANVSHELRTPIQLVKGFSETLIENINEQNIGDTKQIIHFIEIIHKNAGIMENLTNDLLVLAELENEFSNRHKMETHDAAVLVNEAISSVEQKVIKKQIEIIVDCPEKFNAQMYGSLIIQALINLIDNAIKYSSSKSKIWIKVYQEKLHSGNSELIFEVRDKGIGIPAEHRERIFERFYRVDRARSREAQAGGTGLGLSIVRHIALLHKGKAEVESRTGEGSIFRMRIPYSLSIISINSTENINVE